MLKIRITKIMANEELQYATNGLTILKHSMIGLLRMGGRIKY